ncbi:MAG TPA: hypothetical protein VI282_02065 [Verrucomicrobiae bacterium]
MKTKATETIPERVSAVAPPLQIVLTYDHAAMADAARNLLKGFLIKSTPDVDIHRDEWNFAELEHPQCRAESLELARDCDIFVIALTGLEDLPESFVEWLHEWFESRGQLETACVFCISNRSSQASLPRCQQLPSLAHAHGLAFFSTTIALPDNAAPTGINPKTWLSRLASINPDLLPEFSGINE